MSKTPSSEKSCDNVTQPGGSVNPDSQAAPSKRKLVKAAGMMGLLTLMSRVLGLVRDIVSARSFGTTWQWDAFIYSFMLPNFFRRLVGEGALSNAFIPVYSEIYQRDGAQAAYRFGNIVMTVLSSGLLLFLLLIEMGLHFLMKLEHLPPSLYLTVDLLRIFFPYLWFISAYALLMGILNCHQHFFTPALGPSILDLMWILGVLWVAPLGGQELSAQLRCLSWVLLVSGMIQAAVEIPPLLKLGFRFRWIWDLTHHGLVKSWQLLLPATMGFAIVQINILLDMTMAFIIGPGANSSLWYGTRLMQFPLGMFAIAMGTALLPMLAHQAARREFEAACKTLSFSLRSVFLIILPSSVGLMVLSRPIMQFLFERGEFDAVSTQRSAAVLICYSIGLFAYSGQKLIAAGFYAIQDPKTPVRMGVIALFINTACNLILMWPMKEAGLALGTSIAGIVQYGLLMRVYARRIPEFPAKEVRLSFLKILAASVLMGVFCAFCHGFLVRVFPGDGVVDLARQVMGTIVLSTLVYVMLCFALKVHEMGEAFQWILRRRKAVK